MSVLPLAEPWLSDEEVEAVTDVVRSGWLTMGARTERFENEFAAKVGVPYAVMVSSCTAALQLTFAALGLGPGDEVIVPSLTFVATANAVAHTGATPVFADIVSAERPLMDPEAVRALVGPHTRAICTVHYAGYIGGMDDLRALATRHSLALIEDAAHAPGAGAPGQMAGAIGDAGCFSFFSNKNLVTGEGGMVTTSDERLARQIRLLRAHGMTATSWDRQRGHASGYDVVARGFNARPTEFAAALGLVQLARLDEMNARRRSLVGAYRAGVAAHAELLIPFEGEDATSACHIVPVVAPDEATRDRIRARTHDDGIQTSVHYHPVHRFRIYDPQPDLPITEDYSRREVTVPLFPTMSEADVARVLASVDAAILEGRPYDSPGVR